MPTTIKYTPNGHHGMSAEVRSPLGYRLTVAGLLTDPAPEVSGNTRMTTNRALVNNAWAWAKLEKETRKTPNPEKKQSFQALAKNHRRIVEDIAPLLDSRTEEFQTGWCSGCITHTEHVLSTTGRTTLSAYLCWECGTPTLRCTAPRCDHMARRPRGGRGTPPFCAEHRHEIASFTRADTPLDDIADWAVMQDYQSHNYTRSTKIAAAVGVGAGVIATGGLFAAPAIGGAVGSAMTPGLVGAAATSHGLAFLGGGTLAAGGFGMVGGTYVIAAAGAALGGGLGATVTNAYVSQDKSFRIDKFRKGAGTPVIVARGFGTETDSEWSEAMQMIEARFPDSPIYRLHWGSTELEDLAFTAGQGVAIQQGVKQLVKLGAKAAKKQAAFIPVIGQAVTAATLAKNPWTVARARADKTGVALAGILARSTVDSYILVGHSLGAQVMVTAVETMATDTQAPTIEEVHLLGAAVNADSDWGLLNQGTRTVVRNYHSRNDKVLQWMYKTAQLGKPAAGFGGMNAPFDKIKDHDVTKQVDGHSRYFGGAKLR